MRPTYIEPGRLYPTARNYPFIHVPSARTAQRAYPASYSTLMLGSRSSSNFFRQGISTSAQFSQTSLNFSSKVDRSKASFCNTPAASTICSPKESATGYIHRLDPTYTPPSELAKRPSPVRRSLKYASTPTAGAHETPLQRAKQQILSLLQLHKLPVSPTVQQELEDIIDSLGVQGSTASGERPDSSELKLKDQRLRQELARIQQSLSLCNTMIAIQADRLDVGLRALSNELKKNPAVMKLEENESGEDYGLNELGATSQKRSRSQAPKAERSLPERVRVSEIQKDLANLIAELKKKDERIRQCEGIFVKKDAIIRSLLGLCNTVSATAPPAMVVISEHTGEDSPRAEADSVERLCSEVTGFLSTLDKLRTAAANEDPALDSLRATMEGQKAVLYSLATAERQRANLKLSVATEKSKEGAESEQVGGKTKKEQLALRCEELESELAKTKELSLAARKAAVSDYVRQSKAKLERALSSSSMVSCRIFAKSFETKIDSLTERVVALAQKLALVQDCSANFRAACVSELELQLRTHDESEKRLQAQIRELKQTLLKTAASRTIMGRELEVLRRKTERLQTRVIPRVRSLHVTTDRSGIKLRVEETLGQWTERAQAIEDAADAGAMRVDRLRTKLEYLTNSLSAKLKKRDTPASTPRRGPEKKLSELAQQVASQAEKILALEEQNRTLKRMQSSSAQESSEFSLSLDSILSELSSQISHARSVAESNAGIKTRLQSALLTMRQTWTKDTARRKQRRMENESLRRRMKEKDEEVAELKRSLEGSQTLLDSAQKTLVRKTRDWVDQIKKMSAHRDPSFAELLSETAKRSEEIKALRAECEQYRTRCRAAEGEARQLRSRSVSPQPQPQIVPKRVKMLIMERVRRLGQGRNLGIVPKVEDLGERVELLQGAVETLRRIIIAGKAKSASQTASATELTRKEAAAKDIEILRLRSALSQLTTSVSGLKSGLYAISDEQQNCARSVSAEISSVIDTVQAKLTAATSLSKDKADIETGALARLRRELERTQKECASQEDDLKAMVEENSLLEDKNEKLSNRNARLEKQCNRIKIALQQFNPAAGQIQSELLAKIAGNDGRIQKIAEAMAGYSKTFKLSSSTARVLRKISSKELPSESSEETVKRLQLALINASKDLDQLNEKYTTLLVDSRSSSSDLQTAKELAERNALLISEAGNVLTQILSHNGIPVPGEAKGPGYLEYLIKAARELLTMMQESDKIINSEENSLDEPIPRRGSNATPDKRPSGKLVPAEKDSSMRLERRQATEPKDVSGDCDQRSLAPRTERSFRNNSLEYSGIQEPHKRLLVKIMALEKMVSEYKYSLWDCQKKVREKEAAVHDNNNIHLR